jgi:hypothetical protein
MPKLQCINDKTKTYNGNENTPLGLGYSAQGCNVGDIMIGKDNLKYIVIQTKDIKKWSKYIEKKYNKLNNEDNFNNIENSFIEKRIDIEKIDDETIEKIDETIEKIDDETIEKIDETIEKIDEPIEKIDDETIEKIDEPIEKIDEPIEKIDEPIEKIDDETIEKIDEPIEKIDIIENKKNTLENLGTNYFNSCYIPNFDKKIKKDETGLEEKIGGRLPFFIKDEIWPLDIECKPMIFLCQYKDKKNKKQMVRIFYSLNNDVKVFFVELNKENISNQIYIEQPIYNEPIFISSWNIDIELISYLELKKTRNISFEKYKEHPMYPTENIKIGGTCINSNISKPNLIQLTSNYININNKLLNIYEYKENEYKMDFIDK